MAGLPKLPWRTSAIRKAKADEAVALTQIAIAAKRHWGYTDADLERWRAELTISSTLLQSQPAWVWDDAGQVRGFLTLQRDGRHCSLANLWVLPEVMRRGIGSALLKRALEYATEHHINALTIDADPQAEVFYLKCGAVRIGSIAAPASGAPQRQRPQLLIFSE